MLVPTQVGHDSCRTPTLGLQQQLSVLSSRQRLHTLLLLVSYPHSSLAHHEFAWELPQANRRLCLEWHQSVLEHLECWERQLCCLQNVTSNGSKVGMMQR